MKKIPEFILLNPVQYCKICLDTKLPDVCIGTFRAVVPREEKGRLVVAEVELSDRLCSYESKVHILIHELLHGIATMLKDNGVIKRQPDEKFIENAAGPLLFALGANGFLNGITKNSLIPHCTFNLSELEESGWQNASKTHTVAPGSPQIEKR